MELSTIAIAVKLNTQQPMSRDETWWLAFGMIIDRLGLI